jgi:signal transduction histidine kinase
MLNASLSVDLKQPLNIIDDHFLSVVTTLFIEGMAIDQQNDQVLHNKPFRAHTGEPHDQVMKLPLPYSKETEAIALKEYGTRKAYSHNNKRRTRREETSRTLRTLILGLSDAFNNLLMGIWGNLSLINLTIDKSNPVSQRVSEMEQLIQNGAALINGIFGYLGERRVVAKNIRLNQLIQEINDSLPVDGVRIKNDIIQASLIYPSGHNSNAIIAASLARMLEQFMERIQHHHHLILEENTLAKTLRDRFNTVERLMHRAWEIISRLKLYVGMSKCRAKKMSVRALTKKIAKQFAKKNPHLKISLEIAQKLPLIHADRSMLQFVLNQLMENAAHAMPDQGNLNVDVRALSSETPQNRCVAYRWADSIVVTVTDTGHGMDLNTLLHIFDPCFTGSRSTSRLGMGLAAAWGIIKTHDGYIHVRSKIGHGSTFKVYLPVNCFLSGPTSLNLQH